LFNHSQYISQKAKDAIVDQFRDKHDKRPSVDFDNPTLRIHIHIFNNVCTLSLDSSGDSLHKRGYRDKTNLAPINEVLAAGMVLLSGWDKKSNFIDPMCGSGTLLIEAAMIANNIPPGYYREHFGFENWNKFMAFDEELFNKLLDKAIDRINENNPTIIGCDISKNVAKIAKENVKLAKVNDVIQIRSCDMADIEDLPVGNGVVVMNPPYGERMIKDNIEELYKSIGDTFKTKFTGYDCWVISSNVDALKRIGLRASRKITLFNGSLECKYMKYEMYKGTKKLHKLENKE
jgi:putative N6-adenine-specific DNA methylase